MEFRNRQGTAVDPVPFFVVGASVFVVVYSFGPAYLAALSLPFDAALAVCTGVWGALLAAAYYRLVWTSRPEHRGLVSPARRLQRLFYAVVTGIALLGLLSIPLLV